jgi:hypothetical protein
VAETVVMKWAKEEIRKFASVRQLGRNAADVEVDLDQLDERKARAGRALVLGAWTEAQVAAEVAKVDALRAEIEAAGRAHTVIRRGIDWSAPAGEVNRQLRDLWRTIELGPDMRPSAADWIVKPEPDESRADLRGQTG